jgi:hypothetical protein
MGIVTDEKGVKGLQGRPPAFRRSLDVVPGKFRISPGSRRKQIH